MDELVARLRRRDEAALAALYDATSRRAFGLAMRVLGDEGAAADVVQEAFTWIWERADRLDAARGQVEGLLLTIVHRRAIDVVRRRRRQDARTRPLGDAEDVLDEQDATTQADLEARFAAVHAALPELPGEQRAILEQVYFEGLSQVEVAARAGIPLGTVKSRLRLGLEKLRDAMGAVRS